LGKGVLFGIADSGRKPVEREPTSAVFRISAVLLKPKCAIRARKNVDAIVAIWIFDRCENLVTHRRCDV